MLGVWPCFVMIPYYYADLQSRKFSEPVCLENDIDGATPLTSPSQLLNLRNPITCTYECFSSRTSRIRDSEEISIVPESVFVLSGTPSNGSGCCHAVDIDIYPVLCHRRRVPKRGSLRGDEQNLAASPGMGFNERISGSHRHSNWNDFHLP